MWRRCRLAPGPALAGLAAAAWQGDGPGSLGDDELIGLAQAGRRLASWAAALELSAVGELMERRAAQEAAGQTGVGEHAADEVAAALTLTARSAGRLTDHALVLRRLPATLGARTAGDIDLPRALVICDEVTGLDPAHAGAVERAVIGAATTQTTGQLRAAVHRAVIAADPDAAHRRKQEARRQARVERWNEQTGTAALAGRDLPTAQALAADHHLTALARQLQATGTPGTLDNLRAHAFLSLLTGHRPFPPGPATAASATSPTTGPDRPAVDRDRPTAGAGAGTSCTASAAPGSPPTRAAPARAPGVINLTVPLALCRR